MIYYKLYIVLQTTRFLCTQHLVFCRRYTVCTRFAVSYISVRPGLVVSLCLIVPEGTFQSALVKIKYAAFVYVIGYSRAIFHHQVSYLTLFVLC